MTSEECHIRAAECAANAALSNVESVSLQFLKLAAQWRAMAERQIFLGHIEDSEIPTKTSAPRLLV